MGHPAIPQATPGRVLARTQAAAAQYLVLLQAAALQGLSILKVLAEQLHSMPEMMGARLALTAVGKKIRWSSKSLKVQPEMSQLQKKRQAHVRARHGQLRHPEKKCGWEKAMSGSGMEEEW